MLYTRSEFIQKITRAGLALGLILLAYFLGRRVTAGNDCSVCPGNGICKGKTDCENFAKK